MKKRILALLLAVCVTLGATACQDSQNNSSSSPATSSTESESKTESKEDSKTESEQESKEEVTEAPESSEAPDSSEEESSKDESSEAPVNEKYVAGGEITQGMKDISVLNEGNKVRLAEFLKKTQLGEDVTVGFIGGSITQGSSAGNELCYARLTADWLQSICPQSKVSYVNAGIGATGSYIGVHRVTDDLLSKEPDLVFVEFSVNDTTENTQRNIEAYDSLLRTIWNSETKPAIITIATVQENGTSFQQYHYEIVKKYDLPMISYGDAILSVINKGDIAWKEISDDNIHPNVPGHNALSQMLCAYITDVAANLDSITGEESDFTVKASTAGFENGKLLTPNNTEPSANSGFMFKKGFFGGFDGMWIAIGSDAKPYADDINLTFEVEAKSIGLLYGKLTTDNATSADIYIDGELVATINAAFPGGWGNYVECAHLKSFTETAKHTVKIVPKTKDGGAAFYVNALAIS
ncbi:MAG: SGNH/GDSL hydrolase family protein [Ruminococcaceae bacterium]|nr:SGNH/GDSL hydrolase family protein [Oscillospiraceae bacterium]